MRLQSIVLAPAVALALALGSVPAAHAAAVADATGTWTWKFEPPNGGDPIEITLKLKQDKEKLTGSIGRTEGTATEIKDGQIKDGEFSFTTTRERNGQTVTQKFTGKVDGDTMKGQVKMTINGEDRMFDWEAKRSS
jgi:hypothetical protein